MSSPGMKSPVDDCIKTSVGDGDTSVFTNGDEAKIEPGEPL